MCGCACTRICVHASVCDVCKYACECVCVRVVGECVCVCFCTLASLQGVFQVSALTERQEVLDSILGFVQRTQATRLASRGECCCLHNPPSRTLFSNTSLKVARFSSTSKLVPKNCVSYTLQSAENSQPIPFGHFILSFFISVFS